MAACTPGAYLITIRTACLCSMALHHAAALSFSYNYSKPGDLDRANLTYINNSSNSDDRVSLTPEAMTSQSTGRVAYPRPVRLWDHRTGKVASFTTNFSFAIINGGGGGGAYITNGTTTGGGANITNSRGDGMAFCVGPFPASLPSDSLGGFLGLFNNYSNVSSPPSPSSSPPRTVGVEFDTFKNPSIDPLDVTADHIGIDINSISSASYTKLPNLALSGTMSASITYNGGSKVMSVSLWLADGDLYTVEARVDLRDAGVPRDAAVGFSAATGRLVESHQLLSWSFTSTDPSKIEPWVIILMAVASASLAGLVAALLCTIMPRQHKPPPTEKIELQVAREFSYDDLSDATNNFSHERRLGAGAFGEVYKGLLPKEKRSFVAKAFMTKSMRDHLRTRPIAVKRLKEVMMERARHDYVTEIMTLGQLSHRNLVKLVGWCDGGGRGGADKPLLLVYELVPNKSLDEHLHGSSSERRRLLTWPERYKIILGIGSAIEYLHTGYRNPILHRDIKPSNVMLDDAFEAKLGDFGLVRQVEAGQGSLRGTIMVGSLDYMDPSCITTESATTASDMYSFGVLLLEIATGKRPRVLKLQQRDGGEEAALGGLPNFLVKAVRESYGKGAVLEMADARLSGEFDESQMERVLLVGLLCVQQDRRSRPAIRDAVNLLTNLRHPVPEVIGV